eukprot:TRINITY_DN8879_c0_g1_i1.p1 TRINITY_DN8879_c0_g1~~TRINITY_DN8879_c0_g1_i1.p1  ORF type:complete len:126 (+),score=38.42 TRINITY_DN8879_c0_g1_i1:172-549(+)
MVPPPSETEIEEKDNTTDAIQFSAAIGSGVAVSALGTKIALLTLGFGTKGIVAGSVAAGLMGPVTVAGSLMATAQSLGTISTVGMLLGPIGIIGGVVGFGAICTYKIAKTLYEEEETEYKEECSM